MWDFRFENSDLRHFDILNRFKIINYLTLNYINTAYLFN